MSAPVRTRIGDSELVERGTTGSPSTKRWDVYTTLERDSWGGRSGADG
jgi:hypothetical protein